MTATGEKTVTITLTADEVTTTAQSLSTQVQHYERLIVDGAAQNISQASMEAWAEIASYYRDLYRRFLSAAAAAEPVALPDLDKQRETISRFSFRKPEQDAASA